MNGLELAFWHCLMNGFPCDQMTPRGMGKKKNCDTKQTKTKKNSLLLIMQIKIRLVVELIN